MTTTKTNTQTTLAKQVAVWTVREKDGAKGYAVVLNGKPRFYRVDKNDEEAFLNRAEALDAIQEELDKVAPKPVAPKPVKPEVVKAEPVKVSAKEVATWKTREKDGAKGYAVVLNGKNRFYRVDKNDDEAFETRADALAAIQEELDAANKPKRVRDTENSHSEWTPVAKNFWIAKFDNGKELWRATLADKKIASKNVGRATNEEAFLHVAEAYLESYGELVFTVDESELPVSYKAILKALGASKAQVKFA